MNQLFDEKKASAGFLSNQASYFLAFGVNKIAIARGSKDLSHYNKILKCRCLE